MSFESENMLVQNDSLVTVRSDGYDTELNAGDLCHTLEIYACFLRQILVFADIAYAGFPALEGLIDRLNLSKHLEACRDFIKKLSLIFVACAHLDFIETVENIKTGDGHVGDAGEHSRIADNESIQPACTARTA